MIFSDRSIVLMKAGRKRQTTRLKEPRVKVGGTYFVKKNLSKDTFGEIKVISKEKTTLARFTHKDLKREGYGSKRKFKEALERRNNRKISSYESVWRVIFQYIQR